jgi:hypothetical protein
MINVTLAGAVARHFPGGDVDQITSDMLTKLKRHGIRLLRDGEVLLAIARSLPETAAEIFDMVGMDLPE